MPKFILQPIIENSILHSNPLNDIKNVITIHAVLSEGYILISISDIGVGIPSTKLISIQNMLQQANLAPGETDITVPLLKDDTIGIGLINIHKRIRLQFGSDCGLSISSLEGLGTTITIRIK
jgi:two-component system sensor histidine kinase YesM